MGLRIRKSWGAGPVRFNLSKSGIGGSIGVKGARLTRTANGRTRSTLSIPGSGISYVTESSGKRGQKAAAEKYSDYETNKRVLLLWKIICIPAMIIGVLSFLLGLCMLATNIGLGVTFILLGLVAFLGGKSGKKHKKTLEIWIAEYEANIVCGVRNKETGEIFPTLEAAAASIDQKSSASISRSIGQGTKAGGYHWEFVTRRQLEENGN